MALSTWYNGFSPAQRERNFRELKAQLEAGEIAQPSGPCLLCLDPAANDYEFHNEDYSLPLKKDAPHLLVLCRDCHRYRLHKRFSNPVAWVVFLAHVRRGGYARDLKDKDVLRDFSRAKEAVKTGSHHDMEKIRDYGASVGNEWFASLSTNPESLYSRKLGQ